MSRARSFDEAEVVDRAMLAFWRSGFDGTGIESLVSTTGVGRQSLYNVFGDKEGLFIRALERYRERVAEGLAPLRVESANLDTVRAFMDGVLASQSSLGVGACLLVQTSFRPSCTDPRIVEIIEASGALVRAVLARVLVQCGAVPAKRATNAAAFLFAVLHGASALASTGGAASVTGALDSAFATFDTKTKRKPKKKERRR